MKKFIVERILPGAGNLSPDELQEIARNFCEVMAAMGKPYHWIQSYITDDKIYCVHIANSEEVIREHALLSKFPINGIAEVKIIIDPLFSNR